MGRFNQSQSNNKTSKRENDDTSNFVRRYDKTKYNQAFLFTKRHLKDRRQKWLFIRCIALTENHLNRMK